MRTICCPTASVIPAFWMSCGDGSGRKFFPPIVVVPATALGTSWMCVLDDRCVRSDPLSYMRLRVRRLGRRAGLPFDEQLPIGPLRFPVFRVGATLPMTKVWR